MFLYVLKIKISPNFLSVKEVTPKSRLEPQLDLLGMQVFRFEVLSAPPPTPPGKQGGVSSNCARTYRAQC